MKRMLVLFLIGCIFCGCRNKNVELERGLALRQRLLCSSGCSFEAEITADYEDKLYTFAMSCREDPQGTILFTVTAPETLSGISGTISVDGGMLTFDDKAVCFPLMAEGRLSPVSTPLLILQALKGGYIRAAGREEGMLRLTLDESYEEDALQLDIWADETDVVVKADVLVEGRRILSAEVRNFQIL